MWQKSKVTTVIVYHDIVLYHTIAFKCKLTDVASFALLLDTFEPHLNRCCPDLILALISILFSPFCPKGTYTPSEKSAAVKVQSEQFLSTRKKFASVFDDWVFSAKFFTLTGEDFSDILPQNRKSVNVVMNAKYTESWRDYFKRNMLTQKSKLSIYGSKLCSSVCLHSLSCML